MKQAELADLFSVSISTIKKWGGEGFPIKGELKEQIVWVRANRPIASHAITEARTRKINAEARLKELELMIKEGQLISREQMISDELAMAGVFKTALLSFHRSLPPILFGRDVREISAIIKKEVWGILNRLSRMRR